ncbi:hypothetical protein PC129_g14942 [Phytophthora cactorum]|uniref:Uncharacterized protein n=2 Tax=Phytophthora cactorum TaxID=29920 RepID=A0A329RFZ4_9STRA|nr:hypothetical protein Pcac1_g11670 [Phytophthora cactorum]KAG2815575.1 hypothetical protein PC112_g13826 [Phytophthora cactorum]KAG2846360.1 hypothetical protein PC111_g1209 [Phytophthora cactorum]KAG2868275.1 hypothetical protein PC113_g1205 [Phytophthora cactorum]KAG2888357.1 hypothetical protein PC115_g20062 [Phytophthora cactorum]
MEEDSWDFLLPWCHQVSHCLRYVKGALENAPGQRFRGIEVELPSFQRRSDDEAEIEDNGKSPCQDLREALGLLAAVAHVDNAAYKKLLVENGKLEVGNQEEQFEGEFMPRFQLALIDDRVDSDRDLLKGVMEFCGTGQYSTQSAEYKRTLLKIAALNGKMSCTGSTEIEVPVTVQLGPWLTPSSQEMIAYLRKVQETIRTIRTQWQQYYDREHPRLSVVFVLESIMVDLRDISISAELAELIKSLARDGIRLSGLSLRQELGHQLTSNGNLEAAREAVGKLMFGLFGGTKKAAALESGGFDFEATSITGPLAAEYGHGNQLALCYLHFDCEGMQDWVFERMSSAVVVSQTTQHLSLRLELNDGDDGDDGDCRWRWQWIIFACFSEKARLHSRLESLTLRNAVITNEAVESMAAVLAADAPEEGLLGYPSHSNGAPIDICIKAESTIELLSMTPNDVPNTMHSFKLEREISGVRLLGEVDESGWVNALIPGFGRCQVQRKSLIYRELKLRPNGLAGVTSLTIEFGEDPDPEALLGLLLLVGASLTHLTLEFESFNTSELEGIVASCPNLVELAVCTHTMEMRFCLRDSNYRDLTLDSSSHLSFSWDIKEIAEALCDSENPLAKCARRMRVRMDQRAVYHPYDKSYAALVKMLEMNRTLEYLDIVAQRPHLTHYDNFKAHHFEALPVTQSVLSMNCKAAFLSVMGTRRCERRDTKKRRQLPLPMLDQHVLVGIFEYAAAHVTRRVYFREYDFFDTGRHFIPI